MKIDNSRYYALDHIVQYAKKQKFESSDEYFQRIIDDKIFEANLNDIVGRFMSYEMNDVELLKELYELFDN